MDAALRPAEPAGLLVVDDEEAIRNALKRYLTGQGYDVITASTAEEAIQELAFSANPPL